MDNMLTKIKNTKFKNLKWIIAIFMLLIFLILSIYVVIDKTYNFDSIMYNVLIIKRNVYLDMFFKYITILGGTTFILIVTIVSMVFVKNRKLKFILPINLFMSVLLNYTLKNIFKRVRPDSLKLVEETGYSFPSGHAMVSMAIYGFLIYIAFKTIKNKKSKILFCSMLVILVFLIGISRVYIGVHFTSDIIAGVCFSIAYLILFTNVVKL